MSRTISTACLEGGPGIKMDTLNGDIDATFPAALKAKGKDAVI